MLVDVHAHFFYKDFDNDLDIVIERAKQAGVGIIINNGLDMNTNEKVLELAKKNKIFRSAIGLYPTEALKLSDEIIDKTFEMISKKKSSIIAIGEVGLDFSFKGNEKKQERIFERAVALSKKLSKPLIVHSRKAEEKVIQILQDNSCKNVVMHCFSGSLKLSKEVVRNGWYLSIPPNIVFSSHFQRIVEEIEIDRLLTETDAPFLSPVKGSRNESSYIVNTIKKISEIKGLDEIETEKIIFMNFQKIFLK